MAKQYFENNPDLASNEQKIEYYFQGTIVTLFSDNGVFSKSGVDYGSHVLLNTITTLNIDDTSKVLDLGCGYGTIGISVAKKYHADVLMADVNLRAIELCKKGIAFNKLTNAKVILSDAYENIDQSFDLILTNPPIRAGKKIVFSFLEGALNHLNEGGKLIFVIQKKQGAPSAKTFVESLFERVEILEKDKGYWIICAYK